LVASQWSLRTLLANILLHPLFNENAPRDGCGPDTPYHLDRILNPWSLAEEDEALQLNSVGDGLHRLNARVMLNATVFALEWAKPSDFPNAVEEGFQKAVGVFVKDGEPGFAGVDFQGLLSWENQNGVCKNQAVESSMYDPNSCFEFCDDQAPGKCWCDEKCITNEDCCEDYEAVCIDGEVPKQPSAKLDWIEHLQAAADLFAKDNPESPLTLRDVAIALKDRLVTMPAIQGGKEAALIAALMGVTSLDEKLSDLPDWPDKLRQYCGVILETPQFMLAGVPPADYLEPPTLVVGNTSYKALCESWAETLLDPKTWTANCGDESVELVPAEPAEDDGDTP
jgi:hypothetical protein